MTIVTQAQGVGLESPEEANEITVITSPIYRTLFSFRYHTRPYFFRVYTKHLRIFLASVEVLVM